jgi:hypothetical protein
MKRLLFIIILIVSTLATSAQFDYNGEQRELTITAGTDSVIVDLYTLFGKKGEQELKAFYFMTDTNMVSDSVTFEIYDAVNNTYKNFREAGDTWDYYVSITSSKAYSLEPRLFGAFNRFIMRFSDTETSTKSIVIGGRVY